MPLTRLEIFRLTGVTLALSLVLSGCHKAEEAPTPEVEVQVAQPHTGSISDSITADATLAPLSQAAIAPKVTAPVKRFLVQRGAHVSAGQLLATLENSDLAAAALDNQGSYNAAKAGYETATRATVPEEFTKAQLDLTQAKAQLDLSQSIVAARTQLFTQGAISGRDLDTAKATLVQAQAAYDIAKQHFEAVQKTSNQASLVAAKGQLDSAKGKFLGAQAQLSYTEIRSPIDGVVTDRPLFAGETAPAGTPLITVMDTSALLAKVHIAQVEAQQLTVGAPATISVPGIDDPVDAKVSLISPALDPGSTTVEIWLRIENKKGTLKAGTPVHASITSREKSNALLIPTEALQTAPDGTKFTMVVGADSKAHKHPVTVGITTDKDVEILAGITSADKVILAGAYALDDNTKVKIAPSEKPDAAKGADDK
jgi:multidrug efflux pump subunit AcrA (membrane-fusion protein)